MPEEQTERSQAVEQGAEKKALSTADVQAARTASAADVSEVQSTNPNKFESMTKLPTIRDGMSLDEARESFGIFMGDNTTVTATGIEALLPKKKVSIDPRPSYVEELTAVGSDQEAQGRFSIDYMERKAKEALSELQEKPVEEVLIASKITPAAPDLEQLQNFEDVQSDTLSPHAIIAWDPREQLKQWGDGVNKTAKQAKQAASEVSADLTKDGAVLDKPGHPYKDNPDQLMDYNACGKAWNHFPALKRHANLDSALLPAIIRNEVRSLRPDDQLIWNPSAEHGLGLEKNRTIGPANMSTSNIDRLILKYPQLTDPELGGIDPKHPYRDAVNPAKAAWLCAAYLAEPAENLEAKGHKSVSHRDLIKSYNPNADQDSQFKRIHEQIIQVKQHHPLFRAD